MDSNQTPTGIKQIIQSMIPEGPSVKEGTVTSDFSVERDFEK